MQAHGDLPQLILSDVNMPVMDGVMLAAEVRRSFPNDGIAMILLTSGGFQMV